MMQAPIDPVALTQALVRMSTVNTPGHEDQCTNYLADLLEQAGFTCRQVAFAERRNSLVARLGNAAGGPPLAFTGHVDVVPLGNAPWTHDPFAANIVDGRMYGRGTSDMKSGVAAFTAAAIDMAPQIRDTAGVTLIITAGEETGCEGAFHLVGQAETRDLMGNAGALIVAEPTSNEPLQGHKGALWLKVSAKGVTAHGSMPEHGDNAIYKIAQAALALKEFDFNVQAHPLMGNPTLNVGVIHGGLNINSVPDAAEILVDIRSVAGQTHDDILRRVQEIVGSELTVETLIDLESVYTDPSDDWTRRVASFCPGGATSRIVSYFTDAAALRRPLGGPPTLILGPGDAHMAHQTDEYCPVYRITEARDIYARAIEDWCLS
ncbi:MAG TPA: M20 family metallopeptidase [Burkholderiaceae bacterium]|nr:M20 family metallopeptidase [Burkholderiaceae bacterium]